MAKRKTPVKAPQLILRQSTQTSIKMDLTQSVVPGSYTLSVAGADASGNPAQIGSASFTSESGTQSVSPIDGASAAVSVGDTAPGVIRVDASDLDPTSPATLTARMSINPTAPGGKAVSLTLTFK